MAQNLINTLSCTQHCRIRTNPMTLYCRESFHGCTGRRPCLPHRAGQRGHGISSHNMRLHRRKDLPQADLQERPVPDGNGSEEPTSVLHQGALPDTRRLNSRGIGSRWHAAASVAGVWSQTVQANLHVAPPKKSCGCGRDFGLDGVIHRVFPPRPSLSHTI